MTIEFDALATAGVRHVRIGCSDLHGIFRGKEVPLRELLDVAAEGLRATEAIMTTDLRHNVVAGPEHGFHDIAIRPDLDTLGVLPWDRTTAWCLSDLDVIETGVRFDLDPRGAVRAAVEALAGAGYEAAVAVELEFYICDPVTFSPYVTADSSVYVVGNRTDPLGLVRSIVEAADELGLDPVCATPEYGRGQFEVNLRHTDALAAADRAFMFKTATKEIVGAQGLLATFMGRLHDDDDTCGCHLHLSLAGPGGTNAFADPSTEDGLSDVARGFAAGVLEHAPALCALLNPTVNAYKRLTAGDLAPDTISWGLDNRLTLIRFPPDRGAGTRFELRVGDGAANPYLAIAAVLRAGLDGLERGLSLPAPIVGNPADLPVEARGATLPRSLANALAALDADTTLRAALGDRLVDTFLLVKRYELARWEAELLRVSDWERAEYAHHL